MNRRDFEYSALVVLSSINTIGYGTLAHTFFNKLIASKDFEVMGFPFTLASDPFTRMIIVNIGTAIATGSSIIIPAGLAWCGIHYNEYLQRLLNRMPQKPRRSKMPWKNVVSLFTLKSKSKRLVIHELQVKFYFSRVNFGLNI